MQKKTQLLVLLFGSILLFSCGIFKKNKSSYMHHTFESLKKDLPEASVTILNDTIKVLFAENLMFESNSSVINDAFLPHVKTFAKVLNKYKKTSVLINGYTDNTGTHEINAKLSDERAVQARTALIHENIAADRLYAWGHGANNPIASNATSEGRQKNRRVEFIILYDVK